MESFCFSYCGLVAGIQFEVMDNTHAKHATQYKLPKTSLGSGYNSKAR